MPKAKEQKCRVCGCTDDDCLQCVMKTGEPCHWVADDLCSACVSNHIWKTWLKIVNEKLCYPLLMPKGLVSCDYDESENLLELEDSETGERFWVSAIGLFQISFEKGKEIIIKDHVGGKIVEEKHICTGFEEWIFRKRQYVLAVIEPKEQKS
jgi:hypothetical protein